jgi:hypothetical protein
MVNHLLVVRSYKYSSQVNYSFLVISSQYLLEELGTIIYWVNESDVVYFNYEIVNIGFKSIEKVSLDW